MPISAAYLLIYHGSPDPRPKLAAEVLAHSFSQKIAHANLEIRSRGVVQVDQHQHSLTNQIAGSGTIDRPLVGTAYLECGPLPLHQQLKLFCQQLQTTDNATAGLPSQLVLLPLFLLPGVHVMEDIPREIAQAQDAVGATVEIMPRPHLGSHPGLQRLVTERMAALPVEAWILLAHGSRRPNANCPIDRLADRLGAIPAYWSVAPSLESRLQELAQLGLKKIAILPYFLFAGGITDAIAQTVATLTLQFPTLDLQLMPPLEASPGLADLLVDLAIGE